MNILFRNKDEFHHWLEENQNQQEGIWLILGKSEQVPSVTANEALEEALCFGWIDGQIRKVDERTYIKYFSPRRKGSIWSKRNRELSEMLIREGRMQERGFSEIKIAKTSNHWIPEVDVITEQHVKEFKNLLENGSLAKENFENMSYSIQKTYTGFYLSAKREETKIKRLGQIVERLQKNLKPLE